jgi:hypothetical protein
MQHLADTRRIFIMMTVKCSMMNRAASDCHVTHQLQRQQPVEPLFLEPDSLGWAEPAAFPVRGFDSVEGFDSG